MFFFAHLSVLIPPLLAALVSAPVIEEAPWRLDPINQGYIERICRCFLFDPC